MEYVGEVLNYNKFRKRAKKSSDEDAQHFYFMALSSGNFCIVIHYIKYIRNYIMKYIITEHFIDASNKGNNSRFINHSCNPNAETQKVI